MVDEAAEGVVGVGIRVRVGVGVGAESGLEEAGGLREEEKGPWE